MDGRKELGFKESDYDNVINLKESKPYEFDFDRINTVEDVIAILKGMNITVWSGFDSFDELEPYLKPKSTKT